MSLLPSVLSHVRSFCATEYAQPVLRESDDGDRFQRGPFPPRGHPHGGPLVCGVSVEHAPWRRPHARTWGARGSLDGQSVGDHIESPAGGGVSSPEAACLDQLADERDVYKSAGRVAVSLSCY